MRNIVKIGYIFISFLVLSLVFIKPTYARSGCCSYHGGVCGCSCCDGSALSATCAPYYPECGGGYQPAPSCPLFSSYNSISGQCECWSGYIASGNTCISADQWCHNKFGYGSRYNSLNQNCECSIGYVLSGSKCVSTFTYCSDKYGYNSEYDSISESCKCRYGYVWNSGLTKCISKDEACQNEFGYFAKATIVGDKCECKSGYLFNKAGTKCIPQDESCRELYGKNIKYDLLSNKCVCDNGYSFNGSSCEQIEMQEPVYVPVVEKINSPTIIPTNSNQSQIKPEKTNETLKTTKNKPIFFRLFSWLFSDK